MMQRARWIIVGCGCVMNLIASAEMQVQEMPIRPAGKMMLFNGRNLEGWNAVITAEDGQSPSATFSVNEGVIHCTGKPFGYLATQQWYADYRLHVEYRWTDMTNAAPNSGIFVHKTGPDVFFLPKAIEAQLKMGNAGDWVLLSRATLNGLENPKNRSVKKKAESSEKPRGEWNVVDLCVKGNSLEVMINGVLQNTGVDAYAAAGQICLQSEGGAIDFRNISIEPLKGTDSSGTK